VRRLVRDALIPAAVAIATAFVIQAAVAKPYEIPTGSMIPAIQENDRIIANRLVYRFREIQRGDIVVFAPPRAAVDRCDPPKGVPFVKRVIGLPGDRVEIRPRSLLVNGRPYVVPGAVQPNAIGNPGGAQAFPPVPAGHLLVLGDNRPFSCDSHQWRSEPRADPRTDPFVPVENVIGQAEVVYWPPTRAGFLS
jgi:signal peptidase I